MVVNMKNKFAKVIRIIALPPLLVTALTVLLWFTSREIFINGWDAFALAGFLGIFPVLAYPLQPIFPKYRGKGREGQRNLAFVFSAVGYTMGLAYSIIAPVSSEVRVIYIAYFISVAVLTLLNKVFHIKASGHACSITSPCIFCGYFGIWIAFAVFAVIAGMSVWASLYLKRHKWTDIIFGSATCISAVCISALIVSFICV